MDLHLYWETEDASQNNHQSVSRCPQSDTHTHTRLMALFPGLPGSASTKKVKPTWILLKQETVSSNGISWAICKSAPPSRQITTPATHCFVFIGHMPFLPPNQQRQSTVRLEQKCFQLAMKSICRPQQLQLCRQAVPCSRCSDRERPVTDSSTCLLIMVTVPLVFTAGVSGVPASVGTAADARARDGDAETAGAAETGAADESHAVHLPTGMLYHLPTGMPCHLSTDRLCCTVHLPCEMWR